MTPSVAREIRVVGRVQGVGFRAFAEGAAAQLHVAGWVRNADDGSVELYAYGTSDDVNAFIERLRTGPPSAIVEQLDVQAPVDAVAMDAFEIRRSRRDV